jgi:hypothetical protein
MKFISFTFLTNANTKKKNIIKNKYKKIKTKLSKIK